MNLACDCCEIGPAYQRWHWTKVWHQLCETCFYKHYPFITREIICESEIKPGLKPTLI
jgi:hypothetical protein